MTRLALLLAGSALLAAPVPSETDDKKAERLARLPAREALCADGSVVKVRLLDDSVGLATRYGKFAIKAQDIVRIDFARRVPPGDARRIAAAVADLGHDDAA
ncbi:MAG: hypothetical protein K2W96_02055, partial [Gemmataceae bacterium]|nr:hypothetical protein [Gemmataceae bacterium]